MCDRFRSGVSRLALVTLWVGVMVAPAWAQTARLSGVVRNENGDLMSGVTVIAEKPDANPPRVEQQTDDNGRFYMLGLVGGQWTVTAEAEGYQPDRLTLQVRYGDNPQPIQLRLTRVRHALEIELGEEALEGLDPKQITADLQAADDLFSAEQYSEALEAYQALLTLLPDLTDLYLQIGHSYLGLEQYAQAITAYETLLEEDPDKTNLYLPIGHAYRALEQYDQAIAAYEALLKVDPDNQDAKASIGRVNLEAGNFEAAGATLGEAASGLDASREDLYNMGELAFARGDAEEAGGWYEKAHMKDPVWGKPLFKLALVALNKGDTETAISFFEQVLDAEPDSEEAAQARAVIQQLRP